MEPSSAKRSKTLRIARTTSSSGWKRTSPSCSPQTKPTGRVQRNSPRAALLRMPSSRRTLSVRSSASLIAPFMPEHQAVIETSRVVDAVKVGDQGVGQGAQVDQAVPAGVVASGSCAAACRRRPTTTAGSVWHHAASSVWDFHMLGCRIVEPPSRVTREGSREKSLEARVASTGGCYWWLVMSAAVLGAVVVRAACGLVLMTAANE